MPGRDTKWQQLAREAVERVEADAELQQQLSLLPDEGEAPLVDGGKGGRGKGKALSQMREYLAAKGYRFPEEILAQIAGLTQGGDSLSVAMAEAERILAWAMQGAAPVRLKGGKTIDAKATLGQRIQVLQQVRTAQLRAADALMPYGAPKATPDGDPGVVVPVYVNAAPSTGAEARDITPKPVQIEGRMVPADVRHEMQKNQQVSDADEDQSDAESRTE